MILLPSFLVCAEMLYCYTAVYNSPLFAAKVVEFANHYFLRGRGGSPPSKGLDQPSSDLNYAAGYGTV